MMVSLLRPMLAASLHPMKEGGFPLSNSKAMLAGEFSSRRRRTVYFKPLAAASNIGDHSQTGNSYAEVLKLARQKFTQEISFAKKDSDISLAKALLLIAAEDEAFVSFNRDKDASFLLSERKDFPFPAEIRCGWNSIEDISMAGKNISGWLEELDVIAKEVEAELISRDIGCHLVQVLEAVNVILFESRNFKRFPVSMDSKFSYLHTALSTGFSSAIVLSIIYIEICRRLGVNMIGARVGEDFLIWPKIETLERLYWKRASRMNHGLMLTSPLRPAHNIDGSWPPLLRPQDMRLAIMASERLLILQPDNWALRRDHGLLLYHSRKYAEAVQELSICMAFAPAEEAEILLTFVEKLHLLRIESSWKLLEQSSTSAVS